MLLLSLALCLSVATWFRGRQELQAVTAANESVRKTLGDMTIALADKDKEIDRLSESPCSTGEKPQVAPGPTARLLATRP
jgi:hypothetical protein